MSFSIEKNIEILERTPAVLHSLLSGLSDEWIYSNEGGSSWSPFDVVGHILYADNNNWIPRMETILAEEGNHTFAPFDRFAQLEANKGKPLQTLLDDFTKVRATNMALLRSKQLNAEQLERTGIHPDLGVVTLQQLLATWATHDLAHLAQIARVMAKQNASYVGPWERNLPILRK